MFFYSKFHWKSWTEILFLVSVTKGSSFFPIPLHAFLLWRSLLCIFFLYPCPQALQWKLKIPRATQGFFSISFSECNITSSTCPTFLLHFDTNLRLSPLPPSLFHQSTTLILWIPLIVICVIQTVFSARCSAVCVSFLGLLCCPVRRKSRNFSKSVRIGIFDAVYFDRVNGRLRHVLTSH